MSFRPRFGQITILSLSFVTFWVSRFHVSHLTHGTFKLCLQNTLNMSKTVRVYFGVLHVPRLSLGGMAGHVEGCGKRMHRLHDMQAAFSPCRHGGIPKTCTYGWKPMCTMLWLSCLGGSNNGALLGAGHGL